MFVISKLINKSEIWKDNIHRLEAHLTELIITRPHYTGQPCRLRRTKSETPLNSSIEIRQI
jgi:hypothetical protein